MMMIVSTASDTCQTSQASSTLCMHAATAKDFTGLDGCGIMMVLDNGDKMLPVNLDQYSPALKDGEHVRVSFVLEDMASTCMAEDAVVRLTCLARMSGEEWVADCPTMIDPYRVAWSAQVMQELNPRQVEELDIEGQRAYRFIAPSGVHIYSCTGELLCAYTFDAVHACDEIQKKTNDVKVIYVVNE